MSKQPPRAKRKTSSYAEEDQKVAAAADEGMNQLLANLDLSDKKTTPKVVARALLSLLPEDATKHSPNAKKLAKAFPLMMAELDSRSNKLARQAESVGGGLAIRFQFEDGDDAVMDRKMAADNSTTTTTTIDVPEVCFVNMLQYLSGNEILKTIPLVCKAWLSASRLPVVWEDGVDLSRMNLDEKLMNMTSLLKVLGRPQFSTLKGLAIPYNAKVGKNSMKQLAKVLPHLETLDLGYYHSGLNWTAKANCTNGDLLAATELFTNLTSFRIDMCKITSDGIGNAVRVMGENLVELVAHAATIEKNYITEEAMETIATNCPNLKTFHYETDVSHYKQSLDGVTGDRVVNLVQKCRRLETLTLHGAHNVEQSHFLQIANMVASSLDGYSLRKIAQSRCGPLGIDFSLETLLAEFTFLEVKGWTTPRLEKGIMFWRKRRGRGDGIGNK